MPSSVRRAPCLLAVALLATAGCATVAPTETLPMPGPVRVLAAAAEAETGSRTERRQDLDVRTETGERQPLIVAKGETKPLRIPPGVRVFLAGDEAGKAPVDIDNFLLFEVIEGGKVAARFVVGFHDGLTADGQEVENVGKNGLKFEAREVDVTGQLPEDGRPFSLRATALDYANVGRVSDIWLIFGGSASDDAEGWHGG